MLPNRRTPMPPPPGGVPGGAPRPMAEGDITPDQARSAVLTVLARVKTIADRFGLDMHELVSMVEAEGAPRPPIGEAEGTPRAPVEERL